MSIDWVNLVKDMEDWHSDMLTITQDMSNIQSGSFSVKSYGAVGDGVADDTSSIQDAIDAAAVDGGVVLFPPGTFLLSSVLTPKNNVKLCGFGKNSLLKVKSGVAEFDMIGLTTGTLDNFRVANLGFDGSVNYPANSDVYQFSQDLKRNCAIRIVTDCTNIEVQNCYFNELTYGCVNIKDCSGLEIKNNYMYKGSYTSKPITVSGELSNPIRDNIIITNNIINQCGPQYYKDPSVSNYVSSTDGIQLNEIIGATVSGNIVHKTGGTGIRIEESVEVSVTGNVVSETGSDGILFYLASFDCTCSGNTVLNWGRIPSAYGMRNYNGTYVVAREWPHLTLATLPSDPTASSWFETWPYSLDNIDTDDIIVYADDDYYVGPNDGMLPFRGYGGISVTHTAKRISITGNSCLGTDAVDGSGKLTHASDFGFTCIHSVNYFSTGSADESTIVGNTFKTCNVATIYHPKYHDPINENGLTGAAIHDSNFAEDAETVFYVPAVTSAPSAAPSHSITGKVAMLVDTNNGRLYSYYGGSWHYATLT